MRLLMRLLGRGVICGLAVLVMPSGASAATSSFSGSCQFSGPIKPTPPITLVPTPGAHFSYTGTGSCTGMLAGASVSGAPISVTFSNVSTLFDTCELGPDVRLSGVAEIGSGRQRARFAITIDMARAVLVGPFALSASGGGQAAGVAQFQPGNESTAPQDCASGGVGSASLTASFQTLSPLVGTADPEGVVAPGQKTNKPHKRPHRHRHRPQRDGLGSGHRAVSCRARAHCPHREH